MGLENLRSIFQDQASDGAKDFVEETSGHFKSTSPTFDKLSRSSVVDLVTTTNSNLAFPQNYVPRNVIENNLFTNQLKLGDSLINHSWGDLYTADHKSKEINKPKPRASDPFQPFQYGNPNVAGELNIRKRDSGLVGFGGSPRTSVISVVGKLFNSLGLGGLPLIGGLGDYLEDQGKEPYIVSRIPKGNLIEINGRLTNAGNRIIPLARPLTDAIRLAKYFTSPAGILAHFTRNLNMIVPNVVVKDGDELFRIPQRFNMGHSMLATMLSSTLRPIGQGISPLPLQSGITGGYMDTLEGGGSTNLQKATSRFIRGDLPEYSLNESFAGATMDSDDKRITTARGFLAVEKNGTGDRATLARLAYGKELEASGQSGTKVKGATNFGTDRGGTLHYAVDSQHDGMPLYFKDMRDDTYIFFRAFIEGLTEDVSPSWAETSYIGRSEPVYVYERATRTITFTLKMYAQTRLELDAIWKKINRLTSLCYPEYAYDDLLDSYNDYDYIYTKTRMKPPLTKFRLGEMFGRTNSELLGFIESLSYSVPDNGTWEIENHMRVPKHIAATITYKVIHGEVPSLFEGDTVQDYPFYGVTQEAPEVPAKPPKPPTPVFQVGGGSSIFNF